MNGQIIMKFIVVLVILYLSCVLSQRLIAFNETTQIWMSEDEIEALMTKKVKFMDLTDSPTPKTLSSAVVIPNIPTQPIYKSYVGTLIPTASANQLSLTVAQLGTYFTRYYTSTTGVDAANWILQRFNEIKPGSATLFTHSWQQPSVIARIPGVGPNAAEIVILGAHLDSVGTSSTARSPGADDDASGVSTIIEAFRVLVAANFVPDRTIEFHGYAAEEAGLRGSQDIANSYSSQGKQVMSMMQFDMTAYATTTNNLGAITDFTDGNLTSFLRILVDTYTSLNWQNSVCGYGCSDHASWYRVGYRAAFPFETPFGQHSPFIHTANDATGTLNFNRALEFVKLSIGYAVELAGVGGGI